MGGLTVLAALRRVLPEEQFIYLGDSARLPYGTKSPRTVTRYARQATGLLVERGIKALVVACNTASAFALAELAADYDPLPVLGYWNRAPRRPAPLQRKARYWCWPPKVQFAAAAISALC